ILYIFFTTTTTTKIYTLSLHDALPLTKEVIQGTGFGLEGLKASLINYQTALADFLFEAAPSARSLICEHWKSRFLLSAPPYRTTEDPFFFQLRAQRCPHACRRIDLLRQFVGRGNNARQVRDKTLAPATFTDVRSCAFRQRRTLECDVHFLVLHGLVLHRQ